MSHLVPIGQRCVRQNKKRLTDTRRVNSDTVIGIINKGDCMRLTRSSHHYHTICAVFYGLYELELDRRTIRQEFCAIVTD